MQGVDHGAYDVGVALGIGLVEEGVERTPDATALVFDGRELSYRALDARAVARRRREEGAEVPDRLLSGGDLRSPATLLLERDVPL